MAERQRPQVVREVSHPPQPPPQRLPTIHVVEWMIND